MSKNSTFHRSSAIDRDCAPARPSSLLFFVKPELVVPRQREVRPLSNVDNQPEVHLYVIVIEFFRCLVPGGAPAQPVGFLKAGLEDALVHYYPMAGRLRELPHGKKLVVDCTAEVVVFMEADATCGWRSSPSRWCHHTPALTSSCATWVIWELSSASRCSGN